LDEEKIKLVLPLVFKNVGIPEQAKENLKKRLFESREISCDELEFIAAAGNPPEVENRPRQSEKPKKPDDQKPDE